MTVYSDFPGEGSGTPLQSSCLENPMDGRAWWAAVHGVAKSQTRLSDFTFTFHFHAPEKEMATHSSVLAWRIPGTWEVIGLPSVGLHTVGHNWSVSSSKVTSQVALVINNPPSNTGVTGLWVWSLSQEDPLEEGIATHPSILAWRNPWTEKPGGLWSIELQRVRHDWSNLACIVYHKCTIQKLEVVWIMR